MDLNDCVWWDQVSAALDGELCEPEQGQALDHARRCAICGPAAHAASAISIRTEVAARGIEASTATPSARRWLSGQWTRRLLLVAAVVIVVEALPAYVRGRGLGAEAHAARHLATWQIGFGVGLLVAAWVSRLTHAMLALAATFATLTIVATIIDVIRGHRGPWGESVHLVELIGVFLLWRITPAHFLHWRPPNIDRPKEPASRRQPLLRLVSHDNGDEAGTP